ncbi:hypothetical protein NDU88_006446 [Pleurodeles waltl]|uniref:Murine leukemia virus integrase C-terminal domain-containing protein n=1 Tax=Pleurodeles waltl TaxID=8319 RepID=A0AAV7MDB8_PLEWA|nr:hypothetical protein NDU88_006446 [Pleurodeles waltl]
MCEPRTCMVKSQKKGADAVKEEVTKGKEKRANAEVDLPKVTAGDQVFIWNFIHRWKEKYFEGPCTVTMVTPTALEVDGRKPLIHHSHVSLDPAVHQK